MRERKKGRKFSRERRFLFNHFDFVVDKLIKGGARRFSELIEIFLILKSNIGFDKVVKKIFHHKAVQNFIRVELIFFYYVFSIRRGGGNFFLDFFNISKEIVGIILGIDGGAVDFVAKMNIFLEI